MDNCRCEQRLEELRREIRHERELREASERALVVQTRVAADELAKRLEILNDHAGRVDRVQNNSVRLDTWELTMRAWTEWRRGVDQHIYRLHGAWALAMVALVILGMVVRYLAD